jgi:hypothetical protein
MPDYLSRDRLAVLAALAAPLGLAAILAGLGRPARMQRDGSITLGRGTWDVDAEGLPGSDIELLVQSGGLFQGRFLMIPVPSTRPSLEQRLLAVAFADQVGAALATSHPVDQG